MWLPSCEGGGAGWFMALLWRMDWAGIYHRRLFGLGHGMSWTASDYALEQDRSRCGLYRRRKTRLLYGEVDYINELLPTVRSCCNVTGFSSKQRTKRHRSPQRINVSCCGPFYDATSSSWGRWSQPPTVLDSGTSSPLRAAHSKRRREQEHQPRRERRQRQGQPQQARRRHRQARWRAR